MPDQAPQVSIVIPARSEAWRLPASIREIQRAFPAENWEFLIVVEESSDGTLEAAREAVADDPRFHVIANPTARGKGFAVKTGMLRARGGVVLFMDADLSVPVRFIREFVEATADADVVIASRRHPASVIPVRQPWRREIAGRLFNLALRLAGVTRFPDTQCGFKAFRKDAAREIFSRVLQDGFEFDVEVLVLAEVLGYKVVERPVEWADAAGSKGQVLKNGFAALVNAVLAARRVRRDDYPHAKSRS